MELWRHIPDDSDLKQRKKCMPLGSIRVKLKNNGKQGFET